MPCIDVIIFMVLIAGVQAFGGLSCARHARRRGGSPLKGFALGVFVGPAVCLIWWADGNWWGIRRGLQIPQRDQEFAAIYFLVLLLLLSMLSLVGLALGVA
jgi:hypothetical protein